MKRYQEKMEKVSAEKTAELLSQNPQTLFAAEETAFDSKMREVCNYVIEKQTAIILLAGPSASGKTTTAKKADHSFEEIRKKCGTHFPGQFL